MAEGPADTPDVSIIMAAWSAASFIRPAIVSALGQSGISLELIVIDDASPDGTLEAAMAAGSGDPRLVCERLEQNSGPAAARNRGLALARGRYVAILDADDGMEAGRLERLVGFADRHEPDIVADDMRRVRSAEDAAGQGRFLREASVTPGLSISLADYIDPASERRFGESLGYLKPLFRRETLERLRVRYDETLRNSEDFYIVAELLALGARMQLVPEPGYRYTIREGSISHRLTPSLTSAILEAERGFRARHGESLSAGEQRAQAARMRRLQRSHAFETVVDALKSRRPGHALGAAFRRPQALPHTLGKLAAIALGKLSPLS